MIFFNNKNYILFHLPQFSPIITVHLPEFAPFKKLRLKKDSNVTWMDKEFIFLNAKRDIAHRLARIFPDNDMVEWHNFSVSRNILKSNMRKRKKSDFLNKTFLIRLFLIRLNPFLVHLGNFGISINRL